MTVLAWHFLREDRRLGYDDNRIVEAGETLTVDCEPVLCESGLHASENILHALRNAAGPIICRVEVSGAIVRGADKLAGTSRQCRWWVDAETILHRFACDIAAEALGVARVNDTRFYDVIQKKLSWLRGEATNAELAAARDAAWAAAGDAELSAARAAAWDAAWAAAGTAGWDAARAVGWDAARAAQKQAQRLQRLVEDAPRNQYVNKPYRRVA